MDALRIFPIADFKTMANLNLDFICNPIDAMIDEELLKVLNAQKELSATAKKQCIYMPIDNFEAILKKNNRMLYQSMVTLVEGASDNKDILEKLDATTKRLDETQTSYHS